MAAGLSGNPRERGVVVALGLLGGAVAECGVHPPAVVELLPVLGDRAARLLVSGIGPVAQPLVLRRVETWSSRRGTNQGSVRSLE